jgi:CDP-diacylglycerol--serine O-phosphatidyltransferase
MRKKAAVPSLVTICNLFCGFLSIYYATRGQLVPAAWLIVIAGFLDAFDGKLARLMDTPSQFGVQFDSLADVCSFGLAPAVLMLHYYQGVLDNIMLPFIASFLFFLCGALRLARFNMETKGPEKEDFTGLPIPAAAATLAAYIVFTERVWESTREPHVAITLCVILGFLMVSPFEYPAFPRFSMGTGKDRARLAIAFSSLVLVVLFTDEAFFPITLAFSLSGGLRWLFHLIVDREVADIRN